MSHAGRRFTFHGAFAAKADAVAKERAVGGFIRPIRVAGQRRYAVMTQKNPRTDWSWPSGSKSFASLDKAREHARAIRSDRGAFVGKLSNGRYGVTTFPEARRRGWV